MTAREHQTEQTIMRNIMLACARGACRLFRINSGMAWAGKVIGRSRTTITLENPRPFHGAPNGWPDLCGWRTVEITPDMVGTRIAVLVMLEVKTASGRVLTHQQQFIDVARQAGAISAIVRDIDAAQRALVDIDTCSRG
jgi:hypothetical protein